MIFYKLKSEIEIGCLFVDSVLFLIEGRCVFELVVLKLKRSEIVFEKRSVFVNRSEFFGRTGTGTVRDQISRCCREMSRSTPSQTRRSESKGTETKFGVCLGKVVGI